MKTVFSITDLIVLKFQKDNKTKTLIFTGIVLISLDISLLIYLVSNIVIHPPIDGIFLHMIVGFLMTISHLLTLIGIGT